VAVVQDPGEIVLRAFDRQGNRLGNSLATDKTSFLGVVSPQPIAWVTISSNRDMPTAADEIDDDFAIDDLVFDPPRVDELRPCGEQTTVTMRDGSRVSGVSARIEAESIVLEQTALGEEPLVIGLGDVRGIAWGNRPWESRSSQLWGVFADGSQLPLVVSGLQEMHTADFADSRVERAMLAAIFGGDRGLAVPPSGWVRDNRSIVVHPFGYQAIAELQIAPEQITWSPEQAEYLPPTGLESHPPPEYAAEYPLATSPPVWFREIGAANPQWGIVELVDRRRLSVGPGAEFQIARFDAAELVLARGSAEWAIPWTRVKALRFPEA
jgi:hypothetical protein